MLGGGGLGVRGEQRGRETLVGEFLYRDEVEPADVRGGRGGASLKLFGGRVGSSIEGLPRASARQSCPNTTPSSES